jgi:hypothetical protein
MIASSYCGGADYELSIDYSSIPKETADFFTSVLLTTGVALPLVLAHSYVYPSIILCEEPWV